jgi:hypothetical protein
LTPDILGGGGVGALWCVSRCRRLSRGLYRSFRSLFGRRFRGRRGAVGMRGVCLKVGFDAGKKVGKRAVLNGAAERLQNESEFVERKGHEMG